MMPGRWERKLHGDQDIRPLLTASRANMTIRVFNEGWRDQYARMKRSGYRFNAPHQITAEYDDDFYHAVQDTWHLKDWIAEDATLGPLGLSIAKEAETIPVLDIIADLANCTKHFVLTKT